MPIAGPLLPLLLIAAIVYALVHKRPHAIDGPAPPRREPTPGRDVTRDLSRWVDAGLLSPEQSDAILAYEHHVAVPARAPLPAREAPAPPRMGGRLGTPSAAEALGYVGGMLAAVGLVLAVAQYWPDLAFAARLGLAAAGAVVLLAAGALVPEHADPRYARLRWFLWLASTASTALFAGVLAADGLDGSAVTVTVAVTGAVALQSAVLWGGHERPLQELAFLAAVAVLAGAVVAEFVSAGAPGLAVWAVGAVYVAAGCRRLVPLPHLATASGAIAVIAGATIAASEWQAFGLPFAVASAVGLSALATVRAVRLPRADHIILGVVGGIGLLQFVPGTLGYFSRDAGIVTGVATWVAGAAVLAAAMRELVRQPRLTELLGSVLLLGGAALTATQVTGVAPLFGIATALALIATGMLPGHVLLSATGSLGLLVNVPWAMRHFFPGGARAPMLVLASGLVLIGVAVLLTRLGTRFRRELGRERGDAPVEDDHGVKTS
jgi:hypothetical protein